MGDSIDENDGLFWETSVGFLKTLALQLFPKYSQSYANLIVKSRQVVLVFCIWMELVEFYKSFFE